jgi:hypothetical protein
MARKNEYGKVILSAGEIGSYTTCPEAWRLETLAKVKPIHTVHIQQGEDLHREWTSNIDEAMYFTRSVKLIVILMVLLVAFFALRVLAAG